MSIPYFNTLTLLVCRVKIGAFVSLSQHPTHGGNDLHIHDSIPGTVERPLSAESPTVAAFIDNR